MLILTRKIDQGIVISGNIYVRVLGVERDRVKIGISAPAEITVLRQELLDPERRAGQAPSGEPGTGANGERLAPQTNRSEEQPGNGG